MSIKHLFCRTPNTAVDSKVRYDGAKFNSVCCKYFQSPEKIFIRVSIILKHYIWHVKKRYFKNELKHSKCFDHVTNDVMSLFWSQKKLSGGTLLSRKFSLLCDKRLTLYSPRPSISTFPLIFIIPLNFKCPTPWLKPHICYLFLTR